MRTSVFFGAKNFGFFEIYDVLARARREPVWTSRFCANVFYGRSLKVSKGSSYLFVRNRHYCN